MGELAVFLAFVVAIIILAAIVYYFRTPRNYNARELVRQRTGAGRPYNKIE